MKFSHLVWQFAQLKAERLIVLLALADWTNDEGECWPSVVQVAAKARISERAAHQILKELAEQGFVKKTQGGGRGMRSHYVLDEKTLNPQQGKPAHKPASETLKRKQGFEERETLQQKPCLTNTDSETVIVDVVETLQRDAQNPDPDGGAIRNNHHEPSIEPSSPLAAAPPTRKQTTDLFTEIFTERYVVVYRGTKYQSKAGDFVQLNAMLDTQEIVLEQDWREAIGNYFLSERSPRTLGDLAVNYAEFRLHALDRYNKPVGGISATRETASERNVRNIREGFDALGQLQNADHRADSGEKPSRLLPAVPRR